HEDVSSARIAAAPCRGATASRARSRRVHTDVCFARIVLSQASAADSGTASLATVAVRAADLAAFEADDAFAGAAAAAKLCSACDTDVSGGWCNSAGALCAKAAEHGPGRICAAVRRS